MQPVQDREQLSELLERCVALCGEAEAQLDTLGDKKLSFLTASVGDALQQLELILRIVDEEREDSPQRQARQGLLRRLFQREGDESSDENEFQPPNFDVSQQGLHGNSATIPVAELLSFLAYGRKTGVLWVDSPEENFLVGLVDGQLRHANSDQTPNGLRLGEVLVELGYLTDRQLDRYLERQGGGSIASVTGELLLGTGMISDDELASALAFQTRHLFLRLVNTQNAVFRFREGMQVALAFQVALDINQLLLDSARVQDEAAYYDQRMAAESLAAAGVVWEQPSAGKSVEEVEAGLEEAIDDLLDEALTESVESSAKSAVGKTAPKSESKSDSEADESDERAA